MSHHGTDTIPAVRGLPLVGPLRALGNNLIGFVLAQYLRHGPVFRFRVLHRQLLVLAGPEANTFMQDQGQHHFSAREGWQDLDRALGADHPSMVGLDGEAHRIVRSGLKAGYAGSTLYRQMPRLLASLSHLLDTWPRDQAFAAVPHIKHLVSALLGYMATNQAPGAHGDDLVRFFRDLIQIHVLKTRPRFLQYVPAYIRARSVTLGLLQHIWDTHPTADDLAQDPDFVDVVRAFHRKHPDLMSERDAVLALLGPFLAGMDTAANITAVILFHILADPDLQRTVVAEADQAFASGQLTRQSLTRMTHTRRTAMEALRLYNPAPGQMRTVIQAFTFMGHHIPVGTQCFIVHTLTHHLPAFFPEPQRFDITRYAPDRKEHAQPYVYVPYGLGPHTCLGASTADLLYLILTAFLFHHFELTLQPPDQTLGMGMDPLYGPDRNFRIALTGERRSRAALTARSQAEDDTASALVCPVSHTPDVSA